MASSRSEGIVRPLPLAVLVLLAVSSTLAGAGAPSLTSGSTIEAPTGPATRFGQAVAVEGETLYVGAPLEAEAGRVHVYRAMPTGVEHAGAVEPPGHAAVDRFGADLAVEGSRLLVGAPGTLRSSGAAVLYRATSPGTLDAGALLEPPVSTRGDRFGASVALDGGTAAVGAPGAKRGAGAVHTYAVDALGVEHRAQRAPYALPGAGFGSALAATEAGLLVGAPGAPVEGRRSGAVHLLDADTGARLDRVQAATPDREGFGTAVARLQIEDRELVLVGAPGTANGTVHAYTLDGTRFSHAGTLPAPEGARRLGVRAAAEGGTVLVTDAGAPRAHEAPTVHAYTAGDDGWHRELLARTDDAHSRLGAGLAVDASGALIGAPTATGEHGRTGQARWLPHAGPARSLADGLTTWSLSS